MPPNTVPPIAFEFRRLADPGAYPDLALRLGAARYTADTYYFAPDGGSPVPESIGGRLALLLDQWLELLAMLRDGDAVHLPFDFSDQSTGWLRVTLFEDDEVLVEAGWSRIEGWRCRPWDISGTAAGIRDFTPNPNASTTGTLTALRAAIGRDRDAFAAL
ncbi:hypothetical protein CLV63_1395 [Murinocardiopsis flavida]|uniref:Uncharacterized protein n=1 Tax=Murinocardiopsis flavida TaxID=645275 RepID=A0A2P8CGY3_9ACTN|nr:hypothetical protein [Murinocardiopsis flavida]PSK84186.1 hypothetical protein CLV63_1395 [Murinocardiopsis flavida]